MNKKIGMISSLVNLIAVLLFALSMLITFDALGYFSSMFIAFSFLPMMWAFAYFSEEKCKLAGYVSAGFGSVYVTIILLVYFTQLTTVRLTDLTDQANTLINFKQSGLFFNYDLLGYALMALATFFAGLTIHSKTKSDKVLKYLLLIHGLFFFSCIIMPMLGVFKSDSPAWIGILLMEFWCLYFGFVGVYSYLHFRKCEEKS